MNTDKMEINPAGQAVSGIQRNALKRKRRINAEHRRLSALLEKADPGRLSFARDQVWQLAWLNVNIAELQDSIIQTGTVVPYDNGGGQTGIRANPDIGTLINYQKLANAIIKNLLPLVPEQKKGSFSATLGEMLSQM